MDIKLTNGDVPLWICSVPINTHNMDGNAAYVQVKQISRKENITSVHYEGYVIDRFIKLRK